MKIFHRELLGMSASLPLMSSTEGGEWRKKLLLFYIVAWFCFGVFWVFFGWLVFLELSEIILPQIGKLGHH